MSNVSRRAGVPLRRELDRRAETGVLTVAAAPCGMAAPAPAPAGAAVTPAVTERLRATGDLGARPDDTSAPTSLAALVRGGRSEPRAPPPGTITLGFVFAPLPLPLLSSWPSGTPKWSASVTPCQPLCTSPIPPCVPPPAYNAMPPSAAFRAAAMRWRTESGMS